MRKYLLFLPSTLNFKKNLILYVILTLLIIVALIIRTTGIASLRILFLFDSARDLLYVKQIVVDHKPLLIGPSSGGLQGYYHGVFWFYILTIPFILGHGNPAAATLFMALSSTISVAVVFFVLKKIINNEAALFGSIIYSFDYFSVQTSRFIWNPYPIIWLVPIYIFSMYKAIQQDFKYLLLTAFLTSFIFQFESIYGINLFPVLAILVVQFLFVKQPIFQKIRKLILILFIFLIPFLPTILFDIRHQFLISSSLIKAFTSGGSTITHNSAIDKVLPFPQKLQARFTDLQQYTIHSISNSSPLNYGIFIVFLLGAYMIFKNKEKNLGMLIILLTTALITPFFFFLTLKYTVWSYYWMGSPAIYTCMISVGIGYLIKQYKQLFIPFICTCILLVLVYNPFKDISSWYYGDIQLGTQTLKTQIDVIDTVYKDASGQAFSAYQFTPPVYDYVYRYLFWWKGNTVYRTYPVDNKQRLMYLILEPSPSDPQAIFFKTHVIRTQEKPIKTFLFPDNLRVEKIYKDKTEKDVDPNYFPSL